MPIIKSAIKRARQTIKRRERNVTVKKDIRAAMKAFHAAPSSTTLSVVQSKLDIAVKKNVLEPRTAARRKSAVSRVAKEAGVTLAASTKKTVAPKAKPAAKKSVASKPAVTTPAKKAATTKSATSKSPTKRATTSKKPAAKS